MNIEHRTSNVEYRMKDKRKIQNKTIKAFTAEGTESAEIFYSWAMPKKIKIIFTQYLNKDSAPLSARKQQEKKRHLIEPEEPQRIH